jgi:hypothetical protein
MTKEEFEELSPLFKVGSVTFIVVRELARRRKIVEQKYLQSRSAIEQARSDTANLCKNEVDNKFERCLSLDKNRQTQNGIK